jgi:hypothetical protein
MREVFSKIHGWDGICGNNTFDSYTSKLFALV